MYDYRKHYDFNVSATADGSILDKMQLCSNLNDLLNKNLSIGNYSDTISGLFMIFQSVSPEFSKALPVEEKCIFRRKTKVLEIYTVIDYKSVKTASNTKMLKLLSTTYLQGIKQLNKRKDFDWKKFYEDAENLFKALLK